MPPNATAVPPTADIRDIKGLISIGGGVPAGYIALAALAFIVALGIFFYLRNRKPKVAKPVPELSPEEEALRALDRLSAPGALGNYEAIKKCHFEISEISRRYLERRFGIPATDRTLEEMIPLLEKLLAIAQDQRQSMIQILKKSDRVKFTDEDPGEAKSRELLQTTRDFVMQTSSQLQSTSPASDGPQAMSEPLAGVPSGLMAATKPKENA